MTELTPVLNIHRDAVPENAVLVMRPSMFGNPFVVHDGLDRPAALRKFRRWIERQVREDPAWRRAVRGLHGRPLVCCCKPKDCHADILAELADTLAEEKDDD